MKKMMLGLAALVCSTILFGQELSDGLSLSEVTITANKVVQKQSETAKVVTVIDQQTIQNNLGKSVAELLNQFGSVFINGANNPLGTNLEFYFRGSNSGNILILMDGNPVNDASFINNSFDLNHLSLSQIERIEIIKGAQSTIWGSDAVAGVINIITKKVGAKRLNVQTGLQYGSYNTLKGNAGINGQVGKFNYGISGDLTKSKGFTAARDSADHSTFFTKSKFDRDGFFQMNLQAKLGYAINKHLTIMGSTIVNRYENDLDAGPFADDTDNTATNSSQVHNLSIDYQKGKFAARLSTTLIQAKRNYLDDSLHIGGFAKYQQANYGGQSFIADLYGNYTISSKAKLLCGYQYTHFSTDQRYLSVSAFGPYETAISDTAQVSNGAFYASLLINPITHLHVDLGFRFNINSFYGNNTTFTINPSYQLNEQGKIFLNVSSAYKIPTLYQLYSESGNKNLNPELAVTYELGYHFQEKNMDFRILGFHRSIQHLITYQFDPNTFLGQYLNRDTQKDLGLEIECTARISSNMRYTGNLTYVTGKGTIAGQEVNTLYRRPNLMSSHSVLFNWKKFSLIPSLRLVGERIKGEFDFGPNILSAYLLLDCRTSLQLNQSFSVFADLRNVTDRQYIDAPGYTGRRLNFMVGLNANF